MSIMLHKRSVCATAVAAALAGLLAAGTTGGAFAAEPVSPFALRAAPVGPDSDGDGIRNQDDLDDDNDGLLDRIEGSVDADGDGVPDAASTDTDGDGVPDVLDLDSDNDGILDNLEGNLDRAAVEALDVVVNGAIDIGVEVGANGVADVIETSPDSGQTAAALPDVDGDGVPDFRDRDSDGDRIWDVIEAGASDTDGDGRLDNFSDGDGKGVDDRVQSSALPIFDTDGDGTPDFRDLDSDGDGLSDRDEAGGNPSAPTDTDGDGAADYRETDSDGNGVPDGQGGGTDGEGPQDDDPRPDNDGDGIANQDDLDDDNDGLLDTEEGLIDADGDGVPDAGSADNDGDGVPDALDLDSDNDGLPDLIEGRFDVDLARELDRLGVAAIAIAFPVGTNGLADTIETSVDSGRPRGPLRDTDGDGTPDFRDRDSDGDGIADLVEAGGADTDNDGIVDGFDDADDKGIDDRVQASALPLFDTDGDGVPDYRDTDSDGDGIDDRTEAGAVGANGLVRPRDTDDDGAADYRELDSDGDGTPDGTGSTDGGSTGGTDGRPDRDGDGIANQDDLDDDNDGLLDSEEGIIDANGDGVADASSTDTDGDGTPDGNDLDSDNDGILDLIEGRLERSIAASLDQLMNGAIDIGVAIGANGVADVIETANDSGVLASAVRDTDGDGTPDFRDLDSDADGIADLVEAGGDDTDGDGRIDGFADRDGKGVDDGIQAAGLPVFDTDGDGTPDYRDTDSDGDTLSDALEGGDGAVPTDSDGDGAGDYREQDADGDGTPDRLEVGEDPGNPVDSDGDGTPDFRDPNVAHGATTQPTPDGNGDLDGDGLPNSSDDDADGDGIPNALEGGVDTDGDGVDDAHDRDSDNDGIGDAVEGFAGATDSGGVLADSDGDGVPDFRDLDSDNDSIFDAYESDDLHTTAVGRLQSASMVDARGLAEGAADEAADTDGDGVPDYRDLDSDNDGIVDLVEARGVDGNGDGRLDNLRDANGDGADDGLQRTTTPWIDTDGDGSPDFRDLDSDQDSVSDILETHGSDRDLDGNGVIDGFTDANVDGFDDGVAAQGTGVRDTDGDGLPDQTDLDRDGDGVSDLAEAGGKDADGDRRIDVLKDEDADHIPDGVDVDFTGGADVDGDGIDDVADIDFVDGLDTDGDGIVDHLDPDADGNGLADAFDDGFGTNDGAPAFQQASGDIETGIGGSALGCSIGVPGTRGGAFDPSFGLLLGAGLAFVAVRRRRRLVRPVFVAGSALAVGGCSLLGMDSPAGRDSDFDGRVYAGGGVLGSQVEPDVNEGAGVSLDEDRSVGGSLAIGYDISERFSVEGHVASLGEATFDPDGDIAYQVGGISGLVYGLGDADDRLVREGFSVFGRLGVGTMRNQADGVEFERVNDFHLLAGAGVEYGFTNGLALRGEVVAHETDAKYGQLGAVYRFGETRSGERRSVPATARTPERPAASGSRAAVTPAPAPTASTGSALDGDDDGVADGNDACADTSAGRPVDERGCNVFDGAIENLEFESGSDTLAAGSEEVLTGVAATLREYPVIDLSIEAHTDNQGSAESNLELSRRRALAVARFLASEGVEPARLKPKAFGESRPSSSNATAEGRASNRRVELTIPE